MITERLVAVVLGALVLASCADDTTTAATGLERGDLIFSDQFSGDQLDTDHWSTCYWWGTEADGCTIESNDELELYRPEGVEVADGRVQLWAREDRQVRSDGKVFDYTSGLITTGPPTNDAEPGFAFTYGIVEWVAWLPEGQGLWPALWLLPTTQESKPEIDILEVYGDQPDLARVRLHFAEVVGRENDQDGARARVAGLAERWHTYGIEWAPERLDYLIDGEVVWTYEGPEVPSEPMYLIANLAVGGQQPGDPDETTEFPASFAIDRVRVWAWADA